MDYMDYNGIKILEKSKGYSKLSLEIGPKCLNYYGYVHGGVYFTLSDSAAGAATLEDEGDWITLNSNINYLQSIQEGELIAEARLISKTRKLMVLEVKTFVHDVQCTQSLFTMYKVK